MSHAAAWSALADCFDAVSADSPFEFSTYPDDTTAFRMEVIRSRVLFRFWPNERDPTELLFCIRADGPDPFTRRQRVNRFRWLCWAAGVLLNPHAPYRCGEVIWLDHLTSQVRDLIPDVAHRSAVAARSLAHRGQAPPPAPPPARPDWWENRRPRFIQFAQRFASPIFHGTSLRATIGQRRLPGDGDPDSDFIAFDWERRPGSGDRPRRMIFHADAGGTIRGDEHAVREFMAIALAANRVLPSELTLGMGPPLFPPTDLSAHTDIGYSWHRWAVVMWLLSPPDFTVELPTPHSSPVITVDGCLESVASGVCHIIAAAEDCQLLKRDARLHLAKSNPWLTHEDRRAARQAVDAAYQQPIAAPSPLRPDTSDAPDELPHLSERQEGLLLEMLAMGAVGGRKKVKIADVVGRLAPKDDPDNYKRDFAQLGEQKLTDSSQGRGGGVWLTALGLSVAQRLSP